MKEEHIKQLITANPFHGTACLDPRCKGILLILIGFSSYFSGGEAVSFALMLISAIFYQFRQRYGMGRQNAHGIRYYGIS